MVWKWIKSMFPVFRPIELAVLDAVAQKLPPATRSIFELQVREINKVQRHSDEREVNLYRMVLGKARFDHTLLFRNRDSDLLLANVAIRCTGIRESLKVQVWLVTGHLFSLIFDQSPIRVIAGFEVISTEIVADPEQESPRRTMIDPSMLGGKLAEWHRTWRLGDVCSPLPDEAQRKRMRELGVVAPLDYQDLLRSSDGFTIAGWRVHGLNELRIVVDANDTLFVLAENEGIGCLAASVQQHGELRIVLYSGPITQSAGPSFVSAMEMVLSQYAGQVEG